MLGALLVVRPCAALIGDCNNEGDVGVGELVVGVNVLLGSSTLTACPGLDANLDGAVTVEEVIAAIADALGTASASVLIRGTTTRPASALGPSYLLVFGIEDVDALPRTKVVWKTDGTLVGTTALLRYQGTEFAAQTDVAVVGGRTYFVVDAAGVEGFQLWRTDGTAASTALIKGFESYPENLTLVGNRLYFIALDEDGEPVFWRTDGTAASTKKVVDVSTGAVARGFDEMLLVGNKFFFAATSDIVGNELWFSDGTDSNTKVIKDIAAGSASSNPILLGAVGTTLYFSADDGTHGRELWKTDGAVAHTDMVADLRAGVTGSDPRFLAVAASELYFLADDGSTGRELWKTDQINGGAQKLMDIYAGTNTDPPGNRIVPASAVIGDVVFFTADDGSHGIELWRTDGSQANTRMVKDIRTGAIGSGPYDFLAVGGIVYFRADDDASSRALWRSDGTELGTFRLSDTTLPPGVVFEAEVSAGTLFFATSNGVGNRSLWKTDGTQLGTIKLRDSLIAANVLRVDERFVFGGFDLSGFGDFMWATDGTAVGTVPIFDPSNECSEPKEDIRQQPGQLFRMGNNLVLVADSFVASVPTSLTTAEVPLRCFSASAASSPTRPDLRVFRSGTNKIYYYLGVVGDPRQQFANQTAVITSLAMTAQPVVNLVERFRPPDTVLTSVSGTAAGLVDPSRVEARRLDAVCRGRTCEPKFDPVGDGRLSLDTYPDADPGGPLEVKTIQWGDGGGFLLSDGLSDGSQPVPPAQVVKNVERMVDRTEFTLESIVFPSAPGAVTTSQGAYCPRSGYVCDPSDPAPANCWGGVCDPGGRRTDGSQTATLDARLGESGPIDGLTISASKLAFTEFVEMHGFVFVIDAANDASPPIQFGVAGFSLDYDDESRPYVAGTIGP